MADGPIRVLLVEDDDDDYLLAKDLFQQLPAGSYELERVADFDAALSELQQCRHDVCLVDYRLGAHSGLELISLAKQSGCFAPMIMLTGQDDPEVDRRAQTAGAFDYLIKDRLDAKLLDRSIRYSLQQRKHEADIRRGKDQLEQHVAQRTAELAALNAALQQEVAERRRVEDALRDADHRKDEFLAMLAHELRNPLAPLVAGLDLMKDSHTAGDIEDLRALMARQVRQLVRLVDDLLDVSRISRGKLQVHRERITVEEVVEAAVDVSRPLMDAAQHELTIEAPIERLEIMGDRVRLTQVIGNLLINAAKYTPSRGRIRLTVERSGNQAIIRVCDNGIGISPEMLNRVFELFLQVETGVERKHGGLGIGLTLARTLVEMHGGRIEASSCGEGTGSQFAVYLPLANAGEGETVNKRQLPEVLPKYRVLIVDDNRAAVFLLQKLLQKLGQEVQVLDSPRLALQSAKNLRPDVVISDIGMPEMSGYELARSVRAMDLQPRPTLVALTGYGQERDRRAAHEAGFDFHLTKPAGLAELQELFAMISTQ